MADVINFFDFPSSRHTDGLARTRANASRSRTQRRPRLSVIQRRSLHSSISNADPARRCDEFVERLGKGERKIQARNGLKPETHVGPQVSDPQQKKVLDYIELGKKEGARPAAQAELPSDEECKDGSFAPATLFADVSEDMRIAQEGTFNTIGMHRPAFAECPS